MRMHSLERALAPWREASALSVAKAVALLVLGVVGGLAGCSSNEPASFSGPVTAPDELYMRLRLEEVAINLSLEPPYNAFQLVATPLDAWGNAMEGLPAATYVSKDTNAVTVDSTGVVAVLTTTVTPVAVVATLKSGLVTHTDTALVTVIGTSPPMLDTLSIHPLAGTPDSAVWTLPSMSELTSTGLSDLPNKLWYDAGLTTTIRTGIDGLWAIPLVARAVSPTGEPISGLQVEYSSLDPTIATVNRWSGAVTAIRDGRVPMVVRTYAYGVTRADTATYAIVPPYGETIIMTPLDGLTILPTPNHGVMADILVRTRGTLQFVNVTLNVVDVVFDDPSALPAVPASLCEVASFGPTCDGGDVAVDPGLGSALRYFPVPGVYPYRSTALGIRGRIVVGDVIRRSSAMPNTEALGAATQSAAELLVP